MNFNSPKGVKKPVISQTGPQRYYYFPNLQIFFEIFFKLFEKGKKKSKCFDY